MNSNQKVKGFVRKVLEHYRKNGRGHLPWRKTRDPYRILASEMMLQQTQVDRVIPYYQKFLRRFPDMRSLAKAPFADVLKEWSGLGYNRRAKFLHQTAGIIYGSKNFPRTYLELRALPGVGDYTAKAVRTFAFDEREVMLETNIRTALIHEFFPRSRKVSDARLLPVLDACVKKAVSPRMWYFALMDYGAHIKKTHGNATRRSKTYAKQKPFNGSLRQVRGAVLRHLTHGGAAREKTLTQKTGLNREQIAQALQALERDDLVVRRRNKVLLT